MYRTFLEKYCCIILLTHISKNEYVVSSQYWTLEIKTFSLASRIRDVEVGGLKNHNLIK